MPASNRKKIGIFTQTWDFGGVCSFCTNLGQGLAEAGYDVTFILTRAYKPGDHYARLAYKSLQESSACTIIDLKLNRMPRAFRARSLEKRIIRERFDAIFLNNADNFLASFERLGDSQRFISVTHGDLASGTYRTFAETQRFCQRHIAISQSIYDNLISMSPPEVHGGIRLVNHGVRQNQQPPKLWKDPNLRVVYCGRFDLLQKRIRDIPKVWKAFFGLGGEGVLHLIGAGEGEELLRKELGTEIRAGTVVMHGYLAPGEVTAVLQQCEVILNLSNWEGLPLSVLEGVAAGCYPVLSHIRSGHCDIIKACGGSLFQTGDVLQLAGVLKSLSLEKERLLVDRHAAWRQAQKHFDQATMVAKYGEIIEAL